MDCREFSNLLEDYLEGRLPEMEASRLMQHAGECAECAALLALRMDCRKMDENIIVPEEFSSGWRRMIREEVNMEKKSQKRKTWKNGLAAAAALVFVLGGTMLSRDHLGKRSAETAGSYLPETTAYYDTAAQKRSSMNSAAYGMAEAALYGNAEADAAEAAEAKIIRTADFTIKTLAYEADLEKITSMTAETGGRVEYLSVNSDWNGSALRMASLTLRIPSDRLDDFIAGAQGIGTLSRLTQQSQDISGSYYDLAARLETQQQKMERLTALMSSADNIADLIEIESAIADAQYWIDYYTGRLNSYDSQVDDSTVSISLQETKRAESESIPLHQRIWAGLKDSLAGGLSFLGDAAVFLVAAAPWLLLVLLAVIAAKKIRKKKKEN